MVNQLIPCIQRLLIIIVLTARMVSYAQQSLYTEILKQLSRTQG